MHILRTLPFAALAATALAGAATALQPPLPRVPAPPSPLLVAADITVDEMPPTMRDAFIRGIQEELSLHGYDAGRADGVVGARTHAAIRDYQRDAGLTVNGIASKDLLDHLKFAQPKVNRATAAAPAVPLELVRLVQTELSQRGYYAAGLDGRAGAGTRGAVRSFQQDAGLPVTGVVDERLLGELRLADPSIRSRQPR